MTKVEVPALLGRLGLPFAYDHFAEGESVDPPFVVYRYPNADNFAADGVAYFKQDILHIEVYTDRKDPALEERIETALDESGIFYGKGETWIDSEKLYEVLYEMEVAS
jgi:hypothetical protein